MYKPVYTAVNLLYCVYQMHLIINMLDKDAVLAENLIFSNYSGLFAIRKPIFLGKNSSRTNAKLWQINGKLSRIKP